MGQLSCGSSDGSWEEHGEVGRELVFHRGSILETGDGLEVMRLDEAGAKWAVHLPEIEVTRLTSLSVEPLGRLGRLRVSLNTPVQLVPPDLDEGC